MTRRRVSKTGSRRAGAGRRIAAVITVEIREEEWKGKRVTPVLLLSNSEIDLLFFF